YNFFFSSRRRHTRFSRDWSSDVCSSDLAGADRALSLQGSPRRSHRIRRQRHRRRRRTVRLVGRGPPHPRVNMRTPRPRLYTLVVVAAVAIAAAAATTPAGAQAMRTPESKGHANVNGGGLDYEVHGD